MTTQTEALKMALEELAVRFSEGWHEGIKIDASDIMLLNEAAQALAQPEHSANAHKPLTDEQHEKLMRGKSTIDYGKAVEAAAHGIKEKNT